MADKKIELHAVEDFEPDHLSETNNEIGKRVYEVWKGRNVFLLGGRLILARNSIRRLISILFGIIIPVIIFCALVGKSFVEILPHGFAITVITVGFTTYVLVLLVMTTGRDPGIVPRNPYPPSVHERHLLPTFKEVMIDGEKRTLKYCNTCHVYRPPRCSHCSTCDNCVKRFDHHCPYLAQCIGRRNYRYYFMLLLSTMVLSIYMLSLCAFYILQIRAMDGLTIWKAVMKSASTVIATILIVYTLIPIFSVGPLTAFHAYLICTNQTTYEFYRLRFNRRVLEDYNQGLVKNIKEILLSKIPPSMINFRGKILPSERPVFEVGEDYYYEVRDDNNRTSVDPMLGNKSAEKNNNPVRFTVNLGQIHGNNRDPAAKEWWRNRRTV